MFGEGYSGCGKAIVVGRGRPVVDSCCVVVAVQSSGSFPFAPVNGLCNKDMLCALYPFLPCIYSVKYNPFLYSSVPSFLWLQQCTPCPAFPRISPQTPLTTARMDLYKYACIFVSIIQLAASFSLQCYALYTCLCLCLAAPLPCTGRGTVCTICPVCTVCECITPFIGVGVALLRTRVLYIPMSINSLNSNIKIHVRFFSSMCSLTPLFPSSFPSPQLLSPHKNTSHLFSTRSNPSLPLPSALSRNQAPHLRPKPHNKTKSTNCIHTYIHTCSTFGLSSSFLLSCTRRCAAASSCFFLHSRINGIFIFQPG